ncbi:MAG: periplasmic heavy metal sensor [Candidatus Eisenbacteria bacterium]|uniref:Periplasmic heavy metal sensor n=1 Tax=Eiseniibacteriota bacterium TaxID=2212470 RepID=A0A948RV43_UNCEI|nr:periplasmic heavy metal sensor [Candidatus Eisenbacteria bacterium]MBU1949868.1 periplasmic heavy metal sensor [Candidatus Eisenbacteria bacterium]MBU2690133.1 periplasmic heavy metal sensor [Candidatus Eisenbacteria bacterium]
MKGKIISVIFIFSLAFNLTILIVWGARAIPGNQHSDDGVPAECGVQCGPHEWIGFTAEDRASILPLIEEFNQKRCDICRRLDGPRAELIDEIAAAEPNQIRINELQEKILDNQREMQSLIIEQMLKEKQLLSEKQQERYFQYFRQSCGSMGMRGGVSGVCNPEPMGTREDGSK